MRDLARVPPSAAATQSSSASRPTVARWVPNWRVSGWWCWIVTYSSRASSATTSSTTTFRYPGTSERNSSTNVAWAPRSSTTSTRWYRAEPSSVSSTSDRSGASTDDAGGHVQEHAVVPAGGVCGRELLVLRARPCPDTARRARDATRPPAPGVVKTAPPASPSSASVPGWAVWASGSKPRRFVNRHASSRLVGTGSAVYVSSAACALPRKPGGLGHRRLAHQPTEPSICSWISRFISTAYSSGSSLVIGSMKPDTTIAEASASVRPRLIR